MRLHQTWIALSPTKRTVMLSPQPASLMLPPMSAAAGEVSLIRSGSHQIIDPESVWFAISQESTCIDP